MRLRHHHEAGVPALAVGDADQRRLADLARLGPERPEDDPLVADELARLGARLIIQRAVEDEL